MICGGPTDTFNLLHIEPVVASAEHVVGKSYETFVREKAVVSKQHALFIYEADLMVHWGEFRAVLDSVRNKVRPVGIVRPLCALTATCPPTLSQEIGPVSVWSRTAPTSAMW